MFLGTGQVFFWKEEPQVVLQLVFQILQAHLEFEAHFLLPSFELLNLEFQKEILLYPLEAFWLAKHNFIMEYHVSTNFNVTFSKNIDAVSFYCNQQICLPFKKALA